MPFLNKLASFFLELAIEVDKSEELDIIYLDLKELSIYYTI